jgi:hypothetical protein
VTMHEKDESCVNSFEKYFSVPKLSTNLFSNAQAYNYCTISCYSAPLLLFAFNLLFKACR